MVSHTRKERVEEIFNNFQAFRRSMFMKSSFHKEALNITPAQWAVVRLIKSLEVTTTKGVSKALHISSPAATQLVDVLVKNGFVSRRINPNDRRESILTLSRRSRARMEKMKVRMFQNLTKVLSVLSDKELEQFYKLHRKVTTGILAKSK